MNKTELIKQMNTWPIEPVKVLTNDGYKKIKTVSYALGEGIILEVQE